MCHRNVSLLDSAGITCLDIDFLIVKGKDSFYLFYTPCLVVFRVSIRRYNLALYTGHEKSQTRNISLRGENTPLKFFTIKGGTLVDVYDLFIYAKLHTQKFKRFNIYTVEILPSPRTLHMSVSVKRLSRQRRSMFTQYVVVSDGARCLEVGGYTKIRTYRRPFTSAVCTSLQIWTNYETHIFK